MALPRGLSHRPGSRGPGTLSLVPPPAPPSGRAGRDRFAVAAYAIWGFLPPYFLALTPAGAFEVVAFRILMSLVFCALLLTITRGWRPFWHLARQPRCSLMALAAIAIYINWQVYIFAALSGHVIEGSLGYFINPIVTVLLGVLVLREKLRPAQWASASPRSRVLVIAIGYGSLPWIAIVLAFSSAYTAHQEAVGPTVDAVSGLTLETAWLTPIAILQLVLVARRAASSSACTGRAYRRDAVRRRRDHGAAAAVRRGCTPHPSRRPRDDAVPRAGASVPVGVFVLHEPMPAERWIGFALVWVALSC